MMTKTVRAATQLDSKASGLYGRLTATIVNRHKPYNPLAKTLSLKSTALTHPSNGLSLYGGAR
jgi:hypothetical protein